MTTPTSEMSGSNDAHSTKSEYPPDIFVTTVDAQSSDGVDLSHRAKADLLNEALCEIGMGRYQWGLFVVAGFGWFAESAWPLAIGLILPPIVNEFHIQGPLLTLAAHTGSMFGAAFLGFGCDIWGRRWPFNITLLVTGVFALAAGGSSQFVTLATLAAIVGVSVGGNLPVDSAVFLEFVPDTHRYLLTVLGMWWAVGRLITSLIAWPFIANFSCPHPRSCSSAENRGWRYFMFALGGLMLLLGVIRSMFNVLESPRYLVGRGRHAEAIAVLQKVAAYNGRKCSLTVEQLNDAGGVSPHGLEGGNSSSIVHTAQLSWAHVKALFGSRVTARSTILLIWILGLLGLGSTLYNGFLPFLLASRGAKFGDSSVNITYRNQVIICLAGVPGLPLAARAVDLPFLGRRGTLMVISVATAIFLFATTTARTSNALLGWNCGYSFCSNIMFGVMYAISPEYFPAMHRGTGNGLVSAAVGVSAVLAPIIALCANLQTAVPVYISVGVLAVAGFTALLLPFETRGKASL